MISDNLILSLDQGTTSSRALLFDERGELLASAQQEFPQYYPQPGWVEHDPEEIWQSQLKVARECLEKAGVEARDLTAIGITNQRETTILWDRETGEALCPAIVWQDRRTAEICDSLRHHGYEGLFRGRTGLVLDAYFSGVKLQWMLDNIPGSRERARRGELAFGTVDSWLIYKLTGGELHVTDPSNASRTLMFDIIRGDWDEELLDILNIPEAVLPEVVPSSGKVGNCDAEIFGAEVPICGIAGDQQAALFGQACFQPGQAKNTYGTGCFMLVNLGTEPVLSDHGMLTTVAWDLGDGMEYALEGSVFVAGAAVQWLRDGLKIIDRASETEALAQSVPDTGGVYVVPAFSGLGAPHWDMYARGAIFGLTAGTTREHLTRAVLESLAYQSRDVIDAMELDSRMRIDSLRVDGGASANDFLMQFQSDILDANVIRSSMIESTAWGAACLAGIGAGIWTIPMLEKLRDNEKVFRPEMNEETRQQLYKGWKRAVARSKEWVQD